jgi:uncharacterized protein with von Willebrand factor type A (vWA) domain
METANFIFFQFFKTLRSKVGIELDISQYHTFVALFAAGKWRPSVNDLSEEEQAIATKKALFNLCSCLWLTRQKHQIMFKDAFDKAYLELRQYLPEMEQIIPAVEQNIIKGKPKEAGGNNAENLFSSDVTDLSQVKKPLAENPIDINEENDEEISPSAIPQKSVFLNFKEVEGLETASIKQDATQRKSVLETAFIFSDDKHLPLSTRKLSQLWKKLQNGNKKVEGNRIFVKKTVNKLVREHILERPVCHLERIGKQRFVIFIENDREMVAFQDWANQLVQTLRDTHKNITVTTCYFSNFPIPLREETFHDFWVYDTPLQLSSQRLSQLLKQEDKTTKYLIFSDAGALNHHLDEERIEHTWQFLAQLKQQGRKILWLNPMPKSSWAGNSAAYISSKTNMVTYTSEGLERGIKLLRE